MSAVPWNGNEFTNRLQPPQEPIDTSLPDPMPLRRSAYRHFGFFPFFAKKSWLVVQGYIKHYTTFGDIVLDPFSGTGVTAVEAMILGRKAITSDINPVARFITQMTAIAPVNLDRLREGYSVVQQRVSKAISDVEKMPDDDVVQLLASLNYPKDVLPSTVRRKGLQTVAELHTPRQLAALTLLRDAIFSIDDDIVRDLLRVSLANTVRYCNVMYNLPSGRRTKRGNPSERALFTGDAGFLRRFSYSPATEKSFREISVLQAFEHVFPLLERAKNETNRLIGSRYSLEAFRLHDVPAADIDKIVGSETVDYCFTDPPYSNDIYFLDLSTLWAAWLGLEITEQDRKAELVERGNYRKSRDQYIQEFNDSVAAISRALKREHWFTLVYKHRNLDLWQLIVSACEENGLQYVNSVWQDIPIRSTRQIESPNINPPGDMYLNFRKMSRTQFEAIYLKNAVMLDLPTKDNYVEQEIERLVVAYLGAGIELITGGVIQQVLDSRAFRNYRENEDHVTADIKKLLNGPKFIEWRHGGNSQWIIGPDTRINLSLDPFDRLRYYLFDLLRVEGQLSEGVMRQRILRRLADEHDLQRMFDDIPSLLRSMAKEVAPHKWEFDPQRVLAYKQLRLYFLPSSADRLRARLEQRSQASASELKINPEGFALLHDRLEEANASNHKFAQQYASLCDVLQWALRRLETEFGNIIEQVVAEGEWSLDGIDLSDLPYEDVSVAIILSQELASFALYDEIAERVFTDLPDEEVLLQFQLYTKEEWSAIVSRALSHGHDVGIPLMERE